jgi:hypothetical protein
MRRTIFGAALTLFATFAPDDWWSFWQSSRYLVLAAGFVLILWGLLGPLRDFIVTDKIERNKKWLLGLGLVALVVPPWAVVVESFRTVGFNPPWPDAIRCRISYQTASENSSSEFIFYYNGIRVQQSAAGSVAAYFRVGGLNANAFLSNQAPRAANGGIIGFAPQEIWFSTESPYAMIKPDNLKTLPSMTSFDEIYAKSFLLPGDTGPSDRRIDCGGSTMEDIRENNAFSFAHNW